jgi:hypothetical protein
MPPRDSVPAPVPLPPRIMTLPSSLVITIPLDYPTLAPVDPPQPQCRCISAYPHMLQRCYRINRVLSCYTNGRKYSIVNLTTNSYWGYADPVCPMVTGPVFWVSNPKDWLESPPQSNKIYDLGPQIYRLLNHSYHLQNYTNPSLAENCWLCLSLSLSQVLAAPWTHLGFCQVKYWALP